MSIPIIFPNAAIFWLHYQPAFFRVQNGNLRYEDLPAIYDLPMDRMTAESLSSALGIGLPVSCLCAGAADRRRSEWCRTAVRPTDEATNTRPPRSLSE